mmetsp:Transcript_22349/g.35082  ORF Transcript_22349/g.35082 Transcript_22349/m.35082 type:complete len:267 (+) Transcript_22349:393-1193(+)
MDIWLVCVLHLGVAGHDKRNELFQHQSSECRLVQGSATGTVDVQVHFWSAPSGRKRKPPQRPGHSRHLCSEPPKYDRHRALVLCGAPLCVGQQERRFLTPWHRQPHEPLAVHQDHPRRQEERGKHVPGLRQDHGLQRQRRHLPAGHQGPPVGAAVQARRLLPGRRPRVHCHPVHRVPAPGHLGAAQRRRLHADHPPAPPPLRGQGGPAADVRGRGAGGAAAGLRPAVRGGPYQEPDARGRGREGVQRDLEELFPAASSSRQRRPRA